MMSIRRAEGLAWTQQPWTCPKCGETLPKSGGKGSHMRWCDRREEHFWSKVEKSDGCWLYHGTISFEGYGYVNIGSGIRRKQWQAHRFAWSLLKGPIPENGCVLHTCDVRNCVNPDHLYIGDRKDNARDKYRRQRDTSSDLSQDQVREIKAALFNYKLGMCKDLAAKYGVSPGVISDIRLGHTFRHVESAADSRTEEPK